MQIAVTNQKRTSIRSACLLAGSGSHGINSATAAAPAPNRTPSPTSWTTDPLRTAPETTRQRGGDGREADAMFARFETPATSEVHAARQMGRSSPANTRRFDGTRSKHSADRRRRDPGVRGERTGLGRRHPDGRLDPADRGDRRSGALDDLLVDVGGPRLLVT